MHTSPKSIPRYLKVKQFILDGITEKTWKVNQQLPSENALVTLCDVSRMTARRALDELAKEGLVERIHGLGSFVKPQKTSSGFLEIKDIAEEIISRGNQHSCHLLALEYQKEQAIPSCSQSLTDCFYSEILHFENDKPIQLEVRQINPKIAPEYLTQDFEKLSPANYLLKTAQVTAVKQLVEAISPDSRISSLLQMQLSEACLVVNRLTWSGENWATCSKFYHPGNRYQIGV